MDIHNYLRRPYKSDIHLAVIDPCDIKDRGVTLSQYYFLVLLSESYRVHRSQYPSNNTCPHFKIDLQEFNEIGVNTDDIFDIVNDFIDQKIIASFEYINEVEMFYIVFNFDDLDNRQFQRSESYQPKPKPKKKQYVYLMIDYNTGYHKIGRSKNPKYREKTLQSEKPTIELLDKWSAYPETEKELHKHFDGKRIRGEWFDLSCDDIKLIPSLIKQFENER